MRVLRFLLPLLLTATAASCGDDDGLSAEEQAYADAWAVSIRDDENGLSAEPAEAACMGDAIMSELGVDPFENAEIEPRDITVDEGSNSPGELVGEGVISEEEADAVIDVWEADCVDLAELYGRSIDDELGLDEDGVRCFVEGVGEDGLARDLIRPSFTDLDDTPDEGTLTAFLELVDSCGGGMGTALVESIASELAADGSLTAEQAQCVAEALVADLGEARLAALSVSGSFDDADPAVQQEIADALIGAADACGVPLTAFGG